MTDMIISNAMSIQLHDTSENKEQKIGNPVQIQLVSTSFRVCMNDFQALQ
jgi:hypothetical protein